MNLQPTVFVYCALGAMLMLADHAAAQSATRSGNSVQGSRSRAGYPANARGAVPAQSSAGNPGSSTRARAVAPGPDTFEAKFWQYLIASRYRNWAPLPGQPGGFVEGGSPHGALVRIYANRAAAANPAEMPERSIIIKENFSPAKELQAITVMYKSQGWYWIKYLPNGQVGLAPPEKGNVKLAGRVQSCIDCHAAADGGDYVFGND